MNIGTFRSMVVDAVHNRIFVSGNGAVAVFDFSGTLVETIDGYTGTGGMAINDGVAYVAIPNDDAIAKIDTTTLTKAGTIDVSAFPWPTSLGVAGGRLWFGYCGTSGNGGLASVAFTGGVASGYTGSGPTSCPEVRTQENTLLAWNESSSAAIWRIDASSAPGAFVVQSTNGEGAEDVAFAPDGTKVLVADGQSAIVERNLSDLATTGVTYQTPSYATAVAVTNSDGGVLAAGSTGSGVAFETFSFGASSPRLTLAFDQGELLSPQGLAFSPDASLLFAATQISGTHRFRVIEGPTLAGSSLTVGTATAGIAQGDTIEVSGRLTLSGADVSARTVRILRSVGGTATEVGTAITDADGDFSYVDSPALGNYRYSARWNGDGVNRPATSDLVDFTVVGPGNRTVVTVDSEFGDPVGSGQQQVFTPIDTSMRVVPYGENGIEINAGGYTIWIEPPNGQSLTPGSYPIGTHPTNSVARFHLRYGYLCSSTEGTLVVHEYSLAADGSIGSFAASYEQSCNGNPPAFGELRYHSAVEYLAVRASPNGSAFGEREAGTSSAPTVFTVTNTGTLPILFGAAAIEGSEPGSFVVQSNECSDQTVQPAGSCGVGVAFSPDGTDYRNAILTLQDQTRRGRRALPLVGFGQSPATIAMPTALTGAVVFQFSHPVRGVTAQNAVLRASGSTANVPGTLSCKDFGTPVPCTHNPVNYVTLQPAAPLVPGQYYAGIVNPAGAQPIVGAESSASVCKQVTSALIRAPRVTEESTTASFSWRRGTTSSAYGGSYDVERTAGARFDFRYSSSSFTQVSWYTLLGPNQGQATVYLDNQTIATFDNYSSSYRYRFRRSFSVPSGKHVVSIVVLGRKQAAASDSLVTVDALGLGSTLYSSPATCANNLSTNCAIRKWRSAPAAGASGGRYAASNLIGAGTTFSFRGTGVDFYTIKGPTFGKFSVYIDNVLRTNSFDAYATTTTYGIRLSYRGLSNAVHTVRIYVAGTKNPASKGTLVAADRWSVL